MNSDFNGNIEVAYKALEKRLQKDREEAISFLDTRPRLKRNFERSLNRLVFVNHLEDRPMIDPRKDLAGRVPISLGNGYIAKFVPTEELANVFFYHFVGSTLDNRFEEDNVRVLKECGFTKENGFFVPKHKVIGVSIEKGVLKVDKKGYGWVIAEDVSEGGLYKVTDVMPHHFVMLDNCDEFRAAYERNLRKLLEAYNDPRIDPSVYRHETPIDPILTLSRMLLAKVSNKRGEIIVGDLNNIRFDKK